MNRTIMTTVLLFFIIAYCVSQAIVVKKTPDFKQVIKTIDTLAILSPFVDMKCVDEKNNYQNDTILSQELSENTSKIVTNLLKNKYSLKNLSGNCIMNSKILNDFNNLDTKINESKNSLPNIEMPDSIFQAGNNTSRYCLISIINGYYPSKEKIIRDSKKALPVTIAVAVLTLGHFFVIPGTPSITTLRIILYDRVDKRVLFYKSTNLGGLTTDIPTASYSALNQEIIVEYKSIYYK